MKSIALIFTSALLAAASVLALPETSDTVYYHLRGTDKPQWEQQDWMWDTGSHAFTLYEDADNAWDATGHTVTYHWAATQVGWDEREDVSLMYSVTGTVSGSTVTFDFGSTAFSTNLYGVYACIKVETNSNPLIFAEGKQTVHENPAVDAGLGSAGSVAIAASAYGPFTGTVTQWRAWPFATAATNEGVNGYALLYHEDGNYWSSIANVADMLWSVWDALFDANGNDIVDNAEALGGTAAASWATDAEVTSATGALHTAISAEIDSDVAAATGALHTVVSAEIDSDVASATGALHTAVSAEIDSDVAAATGTLHTTISAEIDGDIGTHAAAVDPHGDRAYADGLAGNYATAAQGANADAAYGWGDHGAAGYAANADLGTVSDQVDVVEADLFKTDWEGLATTNTRYYVLTDATINTVNILLADSGKTFVNASAGGAGSKSYYLPAVTGLTFSGAAPWYRFVNISTNLLYVYPPETAAIMDGGLGDAFYCGSGGSNVQSFGSIEILAVNTNQWVVFGGAGQWTSMD